MKYGWEKKGNILSVMLAIPRPLKEGILRAHQVLYDTKKKTLRVSDGTLITWFKVNSKKQAEEILFSFRSTTTTYEENISLDIT